MVRLKAVRYQGEGSEPIHVHVRREDVNAKVWLSPLRMAWSEFKSNEKCFGARVDPAPAV